MIIIILLTAITIVSVSCFALIIGKKLYDKSTAIELVAIISGTVALISSVSLIVCGVDAIITNSNTKYEAKYINYETQYNNLTSRVKNWEAGDNTDATLWSDVQDYNIKLAKEKHYNSNKWTNWFYSNACRHFEFIDIPEYTAE